MAPSTPQRQVYLEEPLEYLETPAPMRARMQNLQRQVDELVRKNHAAERKHRSEMSNMEKRVVDQLAELELLQDRIGEEERKCSWLEKGLERCQLEGERMREELNLHSIVQQHKAFLAVAQEQMQIVEMEQRLLQAESARIMRDHKLALFKAKEDDMNLELVDRETRIAQLEAELLAANTSLSHQRTAEDKAKMSAHSEAQAEVEVLQSKIEELEASVKSWKEKEKEARLEKANRGSTDKDQSDLKSALRVAKSELKAKTEELADLQKEMASLQQSSKEREKTLKAKYREAEEERQRLAGLENEVASLKAVTAKKVKESTRDAEAPVKKVKALTPTQEESDSDEDDAPRKRKNAEVVKSKSKPLHETGSDNASRSKITSNSISGNLSKRKPPVPEDEVPLVKKKSSIVNGKAPEAPTGHENEDEDGGNGVAGVPAKKKTRKLMVSQPTFSWDPILSSGDGVIPTFLSPVKPQGKSTIGTIPRAGFPSLSSRRF